MLPVNTMSYGTDEFNFRRRALFKMLAPLDFTYETSISGFNISGTEPEGTRRRVVFEVDGQLYKFGNSGLTEYEDRGELSDILENGNSVAELLAVNNIPAWVGKKVSPIIALDAPANAPIMPKIKISANVNSFNDIYTKFEYSSVYKLADKAKIYNVTESKFTNGNGTATTQCRLFNSATQTWGDWLYLVEAANKTASQIQFRTQYIVTALDGSDAAQIHNIKCFYSTDKDKLSGSSFEIVSLPQEFDADLKTCYALIKHSELVDAEIKAYVNFSKPNIRRENVMIGTATGETQTLYLTFEGVVDENILQDTIHLEIGGKTFSGFYFDTENSTVTLKAEAGQEILASYECGAAEEWRLFQTPVEDKFESRFSYRLTDSENKKVAAVKFVITRLAGTVEQTEIGTGNGKLQIFALPHRAKKETISCSGAWTYDEEGQILKVVAPIDAPIYLSYEWQGQFPEIYEYIWGISAT